MEIDRRRDYRWGELSEQFASADPLVQFTTWLSEAIECPDVDEAHAMTLATASPGGKPSARIVLLRAVDENSLVFFTNYLSRKGTEIESNHHVAVVFYWGPLERQVRIEGIAERVSEATSDAYFAARPFLSRIGALASQQSAVVASRELLDEKLEQLLATYDESTSVPRPEYWGGYRIVPEEFEFWQGRPGRMHDRIRYRKSADGWLIERLSP